MIMFRCDAMKGTFYNAPLLRERNPVIKIPFCIVCSFLVQVEAAGVFEEGSNNVMRGREERGRRRREDRSLLHTTLHRSGRNPIAGKKSLIVLIRYLAVYQSTILTLHYQTYLPYYTSLRDASTQHYMFVAHNVS